MWGFSHCFPNVARSAASKALRREAKSIDWTWTIDRLAPGQVGGGAWFGIPDVAFRSMVSTMKFIWL